MKTQVTVFQPYLFIIGEKIRIDGGRRGGDWEVAAIGEHSVTLQCPVSGRRFEWNRFCYFVEKEHDAVWPRKDGS